MTLNNYFFISYKDEKSKLGGKIDYMSIIYLKNKEVNFYCGFRFNEEFLGKYNLYIWGYWRFWFRVLYYVSIKGGIKI